MCDCLLSGLCSLVEMSRWQRGFPSMSDSLTLFVSQKGTTFSFCCNQPPALLLLIPFSMGFPGGSAGKESACNAEDLGSIPGLGRSPGEGKGYPPQYSGLENSTDCIVHGVEKSWTRLSDFDFTSLPYPTIYFDYFLIDWKG